jgi:prophage regulatory protein
MIDSHDRIINLPEVQKLSGGYSRSSIWRLEQAGQFPKRIKLTPNGRKVGWKLSAVMEWVDSRGESQQ